MKRAPWRCRTALAQGAMLVALLAAGGALRAHAQAMPDTAALIQQANTGNPQAESKLGFLYYRGVGGLSQNPAKAVFWTQKAAAQGYPPAESNLGASYFKGYGGLPRDPAKVVFWFQKAAAQGYASAEYNLGAFYVKGYGDLLRHPAKAVFWTQKAAAQGYKPAIAALQQLQRAQRQVAAATPLPAAPPTAPASQPQAPAPPASPMADHQQIMQNLQRFWTAYFQASNAQVVDFGEPALVRPVGFGDTQ